MPFVSTAYDWHVSLLSRASDPLSQATVPALSAKRPRFLGQVSPLSQVVMWTTQKLAVTVV